MLYELSSKALPILKGDDVQRAKNDAIVKIAFFAQERARKRMDDTNSDI